MVDLVQLLPSGKKRTRRERIRKANEARDAKRWLEAAGLYASVLEQDAENGPIHVQAGHMFKEARQTDKAERHYIRALALMPDDADLQLQLGHFYKKIGRTVEALAAYNRASMLLPNWEEPLLERRALEAEILGTPVVASVTPPRVPRTEPIMEPLTVDEVRESGLFDATWYLKRYPDLQQSGMSAVEHFAAHGAAENRLPGPGFELDWYVDAYPDAADQQLGAFAHYVRIGRLLGYKPAGPPSYTRWVAAFDTLDERDRTAIGRHIADVKPAAPWVILGVGTTAAAIVTSSIQSLRAQILPPAGVLVCLSPDCPAATRLAVRALVGRDLKSSILEGELQEPWPVPGTAATGAPPDGPVLLMDAAIQLREHATYMFAVAADEGTALCYADEDRLDETGARVDPFFKPDASPELMRQTGYVGACALLQGADVRSIVQALAAGRTNVAAVMQAEFLRVGRKAVGHLPFVLFHDQAAPRPAPQDAGGPVLTEAELPTVTIIIPTRDKVELLSACIDSVLARTHYPADRLDIVVVDNGSEAQATADYLAAGMRAGRLRVVHAPIAFNYSRLNNLAAATSKADLLVLLNNDTVVEDPGWLRRLAAYAMQPDAGAVGPKLLYEDGTIQHAGVVLNVGGIAAHAHLGLAHDAPGAMGMAQRTHEVAVVTGACLAIRRSVFEAVGGLDEKLPVAFNDVLLCLACLDHGYRNIYVHDVWVRHAESKSRGLDDTPAKIKVFLAEAQYARSRYPNLFERDPYYSPNLSLLLEELYEPAFPPRCRRPWFAHAALSRKQPKLLLLTASLCDQDDIGPVVAMQARFLSARGYDVVVGGPKIVESADLAGVRQVELKRGVAAAVWAVQNDIDAVIVHSWPYLILARLLGGFPKTILHDHGRAGGALTPTAGERWASKVEHALGSECYRMVLASNVEIARSLGRPDVVVCPPGADRLGRWSQASTGLRARTRRMRGWETRTVILVGGVVAHGPDADAVLNRVEALSAQLSTERALVAVLTDDVRRVGPMLLLLPRLAPDELASAYAAADVFVDVSPAEIASLQALEAGSLGLKVVRLDLSLPDSDGTASVPAINAMPATADLARLMAAVEAAGSFDDWSRRSVGPGWSDTLRVLEAALLRGVGKGAGGTVSLLRHLVSNAVLILESGLFNEGFYTAQYPGDSAVASDPVSHYMMHGWREGRQPSALFHSDWYAERVPETVRNGLDPLSHYLLHPHGDHDPNPFFSNPAYRAAKPEVVESGLSPLVHYLRHSAGSQPPYSTPGFDPGFYVLAYPQATARGADPLLHFLTEGHRAGWLPVRPKQEDWDAYAAFAAERTQDALLAWQMPTANAVGDIWSAARFCVGLLCRSPELRARFPRALSAGSGSAFPTWLLGPGGQELGLPGTATAAVASLFEADVSAPLLQEYLTSEQLRAAFPFALTPAGLGPYVRHLVAAAVPEKGATERILWFAIARAENPAAEMVRTWQFSPPLQQLFPLGVTVFGRTALATWLRDALRFHGAWLDADTWPEPMDAADQVKLAWNTTPAWQAAHPDALRNVGEATAFLGWLRQQGETPGTVRTLLAQPGLAEQLPIAGINMLGHFGYPSGLRTSTVALIEGYRRLGHRVATRDVWVQTDERDKVHALHADPEIHDVSVIHVQPEPLFDMAYRRAGLAPRARRTYRIGYWYWELETIPPSWRKRARQLDEIWTATRFVGDALRREFDLPVHEIMPGLELPTFESLPRSYFGLGDDKFLFLFTFHMTSIMERKNPLGLIRAFRLAFPASSSVGLVVKTSFGAQHPEMLAALHRAASGCNVTIIDSVYTQAEVLALMQACDAYVSLHRSEGYGLTMAEAMLLGKPVVATSYSGNLDFMSRDTSLLVDYDLVTLDRQQGPYDVGTRWAEPSIEHAAECMRRVVADREWAAALGARAQADLLERMSYRRSGALLAARLDEVARTRVAGPAQGPYPLLT